MTMKFLGTIFLALILSTAANSQTKTDRASVEWSEPLDVKKDGTFGRVLHTTEDHIYVTTFLKKEMFIRKMNRKYDVVYQKLLPMKFDKEQHVAEMIEILGDRIIVFSSYYDKKEKVTHLYMRTFSEADMAPLSKLEKIHSLAAESNSKRGGISVRTSPNNKKLLVNVDLAFDKDDNERSEYRIYDEDMQLDWNREVTLPYSNKEFSRERTMVDDDGSVLILGVKYDEKREAKAKKKEGTAAYKYHLLVVKDESSPIEDHPIEAGDRFLQDMTLGYAKDGDIVCGGFFGNKGTASIRGAFFMRLDRQTKQIEKESFKDFDKDFITSYMTEKEEKKAEKRAEKKKEDLEMYQFDLDEIVMREDGGAVLVGEQYYWYTVCTTDSKGNTRCYDVYVYNDIIVVNIDPNGEIEWAAKVPKRQSSSVTMYSSYALNVTDDNIYFVFNDSGKNLFLKPGEKVHRFELKGKEALITLATVDGNGVVHREALLAPDKRDAILRPMDCEQIDENTMFIYATRKKEYRFGSITFQ